MDQESAPFVDQNNKLGQKIFSNKYNVYALAIIAILILLSILMLMFIINNKSQTIKKFAIPTSVEENITSSQISPTSNILQAEHSVAFTSPDPTEAVAIENQIAPQITTAVALSYKVSSILLFTNNWAVVTITSTSAGEGDVIAKKENGVWKVILGPGTYFPEDQLQSIGAPQSLINTMYPPTSASPGS